MDPSILDRVALNYCPVIDRQRNVLAIRLTVFPQKARRQLPVGELLHAISEVWPADGSPVALTVRSETLLADLMVVHPSSNVMLEIPKFMAADPRHLPSLQTLAANGNRLLLSGRPDQPLPREVLSCFKYSIIDLADERRTDTDAPRKVKRSLRFIQDGVRTVVEMEDAFRRGAVAVVGWPIDDIDELPSLQDGGAAPDLKATLDLIGQVEREEPLECLVATLRREPIVAYKLMRYINSPVFGLSVEVSSINHAVMLLGYERLKRWLALLLVTASSEPNLRPVMYTAVQRGLLMEAFAEPTDDALRNEMFVCGVFSLLDRLFLQSFPDLLRNVPVSAGVFAALAEGRGPYQALIGLVRCLEGGTGPEICEAARRAEVSLDEVNRALFAACGGASQLMGR